MNHIIYSKLKNIKTYFFKIATNYVNSDAGVDEINFFKSPRLSSGESTRRTIWQSQQFYTSDGDEHGWHNGNGVGDGSECFYGNGPINGGGENSNNYLYIEGNTEF